MKTSGYMWRLICYRPIIYTIAAIIWILSSVLPVVPGLLIQQFFNTITKTPALTREVWELIALFATAAIVRALCILTSSVFGNLSRFSVSGLLRHNLLKRILERPGAQAVPESPGEAISTLRDDVQQAEDAIDWTIDVMGQALFALIAVVILLRISVVVTLCVFLPLIAVVAITQLLSKRLEAYRTASREATGNVTSSLGEIFSAVQAIQLARAEARMVEHFQGLNDRRRVASLNDKVLEQLLFSSINNVVGLGTGLILLLVAQSLRTLQLGVGDLAIFLYYLAYVTDYTQFFGTFLAHYAQTRVAFRRMVRLLQGASDDSLVAYQPLFLSKKHPIPLAALTSKGTKESLQLLEATGISYRYPETGRGVEGVNVRVQQGEITVITGQVASGKTTLLRTVLGLLPKDTGDIRWNGVSVSDPATFFVPPRSAYTAQIPKLFSMTVKENILFGLADNSYALERAIDTAVLERDITAFEQGVDERIGVRGVRLSGGQVQRVAAARMFLRDTALLVFDDLSSALDAETEQQLWERLFARQQDVACLVVSHRRAVLGRAHHIIVLKDGKMEAEGTAVELLQSSEEFRQLWSRNGDAV